MSSQANATAKIGTDAVSVVFRKGFALVGTGLGDQVEAELISLVLPTETTGNFTGFLGLENPVCHETAVECGGENFIIDGINHSDPCEGFTRLFLVEG
ncbi:MAG: hypothetical protein C0591_01105 [Marinilabiliales bacterium]|nr:MAG: hypothetical protein C0591_01105 [Marinilabiliales bacterium]